MAPGLIVIGKNSYIGGKLVEYAQRCALPCLAWGSSDCDFLNIEQVRSVFSSLPRQPYQIVFLSVVNKHVGNSSVTFDQNVLMGRNLIESLRLIDVQSLVYFSSADVFGHQPHVPINEATPRSPSCWYGLSKSVCEWMLHESHDVKCPVTALRIPGIYGLGRNERSIIRAMVERWAQGETVKLTGGGRALRDFVHVEDVCRIVVELLQRPYHGPLNVATGRSRSMLDVAKLVARVLNIEPRIELVSAPSRRDFDLVFAPARLRAVTGDFALRDVANSLDEYRPLFDSVHVN